MSDDRDFDALLHDALTRRGAPAPFEVDVTDRVMNQVAAIAPGRRGDAGFAQLARWGAAAAVVGVAVLATLAGRAPTSEILASGLGDTIGALLKLGAPAAAVATAIGRVMAALAESASSVIRPLAPLQTLAQSVLAALTAAMVGITTFVVGRDIRRRTLE